MMTIADTLLQELEQESRATRRALERVPDAHMAWKPHHKSMSLGQLSMHIATSPMYVVEMIANDNFQVSGISQPTPSAASELVPTLERSLASVRSQLGSWDDARMRATWRAFDGDRELMALPRAAALRMILLNHWYHHRGQLCVYLRQLDVPVPAIYGPSADENPFQAAVNQ